MTCIFKGFQGQSAVLRARRLYLSRGLDPLPEAEVEQHDHHRQAGSQLPARLSQVVDSSTVLDVENPTSDQFKQKTHNAVREAQVIWVKHFGRIC